MKNAHSAYETERNGRSPLDNDRCRACGNPQQSFLLLSSLGERLIRNWSRSSQARYSLMIITRSVALLVVPALLSSCLRSVPSENFVRIENGQVGAVRVSPKGTRSLTVNTADNRQMPEEMLSFTDFVL